MSSARVGAGLASRYFPLSAGQAANGRVLAVLGGSRHVLGAGSFSLAGKTSASQCAERKSLTLRIESNMSRTAVGTITADNADEGIAGRGRRVDQVGDLGVRWTRPRPGVCGSAT